LQMAVCRARGSVGGAAMMLAMLWHAKVMAAQSGKLTETIQRACRSSSSAANSSPMCRFVQNSSCYQAPGPTGCPEYCDLQVTARGRSDLCIDEQFCTLLYPTGYTKVTKKGDKSYKECRDHCGLVGCKVCAGGDSCGECHDRFNLITPEFKKTVFGLYGKVGHCRWKWTSIAVFVLALLFLMVILLVYSACRVHRRGNTNSAAVNAGRKSRYRAKVFQFFRATQMRFKLWAPMHFHAKGRVPICGPGMTLFMNWFILWVGVGLWLTILAFIFTSEDHETKEWWLVVRRGFPELPEDVTVNKHLWTALAYLGSTLGSFIFFVTQRRLWTAMTHDTTSLLPMHLYAVEARGFPPDATDKNKLLQFFKQGLRNQHFPDDAVEYISIAYSYGKGDHWVEAALDQHLEEEQHRQENGVEDSDDSESSDADKASPESGPWWLQLMARVLFGTDMDWPVHKEANYQAVNEINDSSNALETRLNALQSSGVVFVVLRTQALATALQRLVFKYEDCHHISMRLARSSPVNINWHKYGVDKTTKAWRAVASVFIIILTAFFWFLCYLPVLFTYLSAQDADGSTSAFMVETAMSMTIVLGNATVGIVANYVTDWIGFRMQRELQMVRLVIIVPLMLLNVFMDLSSMVYLPTAHYFRSWRQSKTCSVSIDFHDCQVPGKEIVQEMHTRVRGLLQSYCVVPYFGEPLFCIFVIYLVGMWRVKRDRRITKQQAEKLMVAPQTDIVNPPYCDIICTTTIIVFTFTMSPSSQHRFIFPMLLVAATVLYVQCRFRILRWESRSHYGNRGLHDVEAFYWAIPLGLLAAAWERNMSNTYCEETLCGWRFFVIHLLMHILFLWFVVPRQEPQMPACDIEYKNALHRLNGKAGLANYLNTNPIEVLKSHLQQETSAGQHLIYYRLDKEYLQPRATKIYETDHSWCA